MTCGERFSATSLAAEVELGCRLPRRETMWTQATFYRNHVAFVNIAV
jgi:hypothetical protein